MEHFIIIVVTRKFEGNSTIVDIEQVTMVTTVI